MTSLLFLIPIALVFTGIAIGLFLWAVRNGQYEDLDRVSRDMLRDPPKETDTETIQLGREEGVDDQ